MVPLTKQSLGSGAIVDRKGYLLTNHHMVAPIERCRVRQPADRIEIYLSGDQTFAAQVIGTDAASDLAVLKIETEQSLTAPKIGNSGNLQVGEWVVVAGSPFGLEPSPRVLSPPPSE
jgi:S1-C subfamily serine protease